MEQLLSTKLFIPSTRQELVTRSRLIEQLNDGLHRKLTLISAPAGFGKTTLVTEWLGNLRSEAKRGSPTQINIAWFSLDEGDNDSTRFLTYFIAALNRVKGIENAIGEGALSMLQAPQPPPIDTILVTLINEIATITSKITLILDDHHLIDAQPVHDAISFLLENMPSQMHLVIATREDPPFPLSRLRARGQLTELRAADLRFTSSEAFEFFNQVMGLNLSTNDINALETRTEGWITGLQLAAISMQGQKDHTSFIESFTGSHRFVLDYLLEEVLEKQPGRVQSFLQQTAILDRMTGSLCDVLTGQDNGQDTLEYLEHSNLFIVSLDEERCWYRYHHLFADLLRQRLSQTRLEQVPVLHRRASQWFEHNGFIDQAIKHALRADDFASAAELIEKHIDSMWGLGQHAILQRWMAALPEKFVLSRPQLCIFHAWYLFTKGQLDAADQVLGSIPESDNQELLGRAAAVQAYVASFRGDIPGIILYARQALEILSEQDLTWRSLAEIVLGDAHLFKSEMAAAYQARIAALETSKASGNVYLNLIANQKLLVVVRQLGQLQRTLEVCEQMMQFANEHGVSETAMVGNMLANWGEALAEINDLDGAISLVRKGIERTERGRDVGILGWSYLCRVRVLFSKGDMQGAEESIRNVEAMFQESTLPLWIANHLAAWKVRLWLARDQLEDASAWVSEKELSPDIDTTYMGGLLYIALARIHIAQVSSDEAIKVLQVLLRTTEKGGHITRTIEILLLQSLAYQAKGETAQAMSTRCHPSTAS